MLLLPTLSRAKARAEATKESAKSARSKTNPSRHRPKAPSDQRSHSGDVEGHAFADPANKAICWSRLGRGGSV